MHLAEMLDRKLTFSYSTLLFLERFRFDIAEALGNGVPYLSREDVEAATDWPHQGKEKHTWVDARTLSKSDSAFWKGLQGQIREWLEEEPTDVSHELNCVYPHAHNLADTSPQGV